MGWSLGIFYPDYDWTQDEENGVPILASRMQDQLNKLCLDGISSTWKRDGTNQPLQNLPVGGHKFTGCGEATALSEFSTLGQQVTGKNTYVNIDSGGGTGAFTGDLAVSPGSLVTGMFCVVRTSAANPDGLVSTFNLNSLGAHPICDENRNEITEGGYIAANSFYIFVFYNDVWCIIGLNIGLYPGTTVSAQYADGQLDLRNTGNLNDMLLAWNNVDIQNAKYAIPMTGGTTDDKGIKPLIAGIWSVTTKLTAWRRDGLDGYIGCGNVLRESGDVLAPDEAQIDYRYFVASTVDNGVGPTSFSNYNYEVDQSQINNDFYFPAFGIWKANSGNQPYLHTYIQTARYLGIDL